MSVERLRPDLALGGNDLAVFVAGPGLGEGVAVALPGGGWLLIDGCRAGGAVGDDAPLLAIWKTWRRDAGDSVK